MKLLGPTSFPRLNEASGVVYLIASILLTGSLYTYRPEDASWNTAAAAERTANLVGPYGALAADLAYQLLGYAAWLLPVLLGMLGWRWFRSRDIERPLVKLCGYALLLGSLSTGLALGPDWRLLHASVAPGGLLGRLSADALVRRLNLAGAGLVNLTFLLVSLYLISRFSMQRLPEWLAAPFRGWSSLRERWSEWNDARRERQVEKARARIEARTGRKAKRAEPQPTPAQNPLPLAETPQAVEEADIPIRTLEDIPPPPPAPEPVAVEQEPPTRSPVPWSEPAARATVQYRLPSTELLNEAEGRPPYDSQELQETAGKIKEKFEEFNVLGSVVQINPGPVVTTFEFKPEAGIRYNRIVTLNEDLCLGLHAESILIERIPGKPTVGIQAPNSAREVINLRQILESEEFRGSSSRLTIALGKDINGRIKTTALEAMPHLLIAGSTGSGKSVMLNSLLMSVLYKSTPDEVRLVLVDPKRVELGFYEGIPHLLTPVITDPRKATNALRNTVLEMERRLKLLAARGVRNLEQYNRAVRQLLLKPRSLFEEDEFAEEELKPLPYVLVVIDELADLMMIDRANVEVSVTRLAQMARAVGMHLVVATQRPSVDVVTGLIKANFPARISFRLATRADSRTILDSMGAEHLLGKGDMLYLPPGSSRFVRLHGAFVTEAEINRVVEFWKGQAQPDYDPSYLLAPLSEDEETAGMDPEGADDPMYEDAVRMVLEVGKASTSTLQRRLRLGYGRAARLLDLMHREGIIGPPDGSRPREVLKRPDWLREVEEQLR